MQAITIEALASVAGGKTDDERFPQIPRDANGNLEFRGAPCIGFPLEDCRRIIGAWADPWLVEQLDNQIARLNAASSKPKARKR